MKFMKYSERKPESEYEVIDQPVLLEKLSRFDISISSATLRNWEKSDLLIPPYRSGRRGGRVTQYYDFVLAECYAVYTLTNERSIAGVSIPRFSLSDLGMARTKLYKLNFKLKDYPDIPKNSPRTDDSDMPDLKTDHFEDRDKYFQIPLGKRHIYFNEDNTIVELYDILHDYRTHQSLTSTLSFYGELYAMGLWILGLQKGSELFLEKYRKT